MPITRLAFSLWCLILTMAPALGAGNIQRIVPFEASAFPYDGMIPEQNVPFLDVGGPGERRGHTSPRGGISWADVTLSDRSVLLSIPARFDMRAPGVIIVFFHGNQATLRKDVVARQHVPQQVAQSGLNAVLVAPQLAVDALDSSAGHFWDKGFFTRFLDEAATKLGAMAGAGSVEKFRAMPVIVVAYSGGYLPAVFALEAGGADARVRGVILMDALFGEVERYAGWISAHKSGTFFVSAASAASAEPNARLRQMVAPASPTALNAVPWLTAGTLVFQPAPAAIHNDFMTQAWVTNPLQAVLARVADFHRPSR